MENKLGLRMMSPEAILNQKLTEPSMLNYGLKKQFPDETSDEIVSRLQDDLLKLISYERVEKSVVRSQAEYNAMTGLVVVTRKLGKWNTYGYRENNMYCLTYYETLYLIDTNRLELYYDSVLVSLEQAYALLLNNKHDRKSHEKYFIYANLSKVGYIVQPHRKHIPQSTKDISMADKCVWQCLLEELKQPTSSKDKNHELYLKTKENMKTIGDAIKSQSTVKVVEKGLNDESDSWQNVIVKVKTSRKRKLESDSFPSTSRKMRHSEYTTAATDRFLDVLTYEQDVCNFRTIFEEIQVIQLDQTLCNNIDESTCDIEFDFDLYKPQSAFKQTDPGAPNFRILIFKSNEEPPTRESIVKAFLKPAVRAPVLVFFMNEFMRASAFLYRISL